MYTDPQHRGQQPIIIESLKRMVSFPKITELRLDVYNDNPSAIRAYEN
jgi:hypothetical protein